MNLEFVGSEALFGLDLASVVEREAGEIPWVIEACIQAIEVQP